MKLREAPEHQWSARIRVIRVICCRLRLRAQLCFMCFKCFILYNSCNPCNPLSSLSSLSVLYTGK